jgi:Family of unknown function (DUF6519)/Carboxypeptidase regulatory-like domain/Helix-hairpin-helix domain
MKGDFTRQTFDRGKHYSSVRMQQGRVQLDADWNEQRDIDAHHDHTANRDVIGPCGAPLHDAGFFIQPQGGNLLIGAGRYYVDGILCENDVDVLYTAQSDVPGAALPAPADSGLYLAYLDVWQRHLTALEDPDIREVALGGPDTATRMKTIWQVKLIRVGDPGAPQNCLSGLEAWLAAIAPSKGQMQARAQPAGATSDLCIIPPGAGYQRLENQLYRVEIHRSGELGEASFKWSRDNGAVVAAWLDQDQASNELIVSSLGRDKTLSFAAGQWVELTDDSCELNSNPGTLVKLTKAVDQILTIDPGSTTHPVTRANFPSHPKVRRWDMPDGQIRVSIPVANDGWIPLEDGIEVRFQAGSFETGDYWLIPARTLTGDIDWPQDASSPPQALLQPPHGIQHHYCRLALLEFNATTWSLVSDCRQLFPPTTELRSLFYVGGDGQEVTPDPLQPMQLLPLPQALQVGVANGTQRVFDATVRFTVTTGGGRLQGNLATVDIATLDGIASCPWSLDSTTTSQQVEASLLDASGVPVHVPIRFTANLSLAGEVAYDASTCADLAQAGVHTVQQAIDTLCQRIPEAEPGIGIKLISSVADGAPVLNDVIVPVSRLAAGLVIECDARLSEVSGGGVPPQPPSNYGLDTVPAKPTCIVTLALPYPVGADRELWQQFGGIAGFQPLMLASRVLIEENRIEWSPTDASRIWLQQHLFQRLNIQEVTDRILAHLTIKGNFIWLGGSGEEPTVYVDGEAFGRPSRPDRVDLRLPSGDGRRGGDFEMWFWLMPSEVPRALTIEVTVSPNTMIGTVFDFTGNVVPGATIILTGPSGGRSAVTNAEGGFRFAELAPGPYVVLAQAGDLSGQTQVTVPGTLVPPIPPIFTPGAAPERTLTEVSGIGPTFRARLAEHGITYAAEVASMDVARLAEILQISAARANTIIDSARRLLTE